MYGVPRPSPGSLAYSLIAVTFFPGEALPYMGYIGMCRYEGYGFQAVYSGIGVFKSEILGLE